MPEPTFSATTERLYERLPQIYRTEDIDANWTLKRWLSGVVDQLGEVEDLIDRLAYQAPPDGTVGDTSDLVDPNTADTEWLPWLAQVVGIKLVSGSTVTNRARLASPSKFQAGTKAAIADASKSVLTGEQQVQIFDHSTDVSTVGGATQWDVLIVTRASETLSDPIAQVMAVGAKPAGIILYHKTITTTWAAIEAAFPTWADLEGKTWTEIEEAGL